MAVEATCPRRSLPLPLLFFFLPLISCADSGELQLLLNLKTALGNSSSQVLQTWEPTVPTCNFTGITCNSKGSVTEIELSRVNLTGVLPFDSICRLRYLTKLSLGFNFLKGNISQELQNCVNLKYLDLGNNFFNGPVRDISSLNQLEYLYLNNSRFSGNFPWKMVENMTGLLHLSLGDNPFQKMKFPDEVLKLYKLSWLYLTNCSVEGGIPPDIGNLTELVSLELAGNLLSGAIPAEIGKLRKLWQLELYQNSLTGKLPFGLRNLTRLQFFDASKNNLEGDLSELRFLRNLVSLQLFDNKLSGEVPVEFGDFKNLVNLSLYRNKLRGPLPAKLGSWADFDYIDVSENLLTGQIPPEMCKKGKMTGLLALQNKFSGEIPASYAKCSSLSRFRVSNNSLSGEIPAGMWGLPNLSIIDVAFNQFEGTITSDIRNAKSLAQLLSPDNQFSGELPEELSEVTSLVSLDLSFNNFHGRIPSRIGSLKQLSSLKLQGNAFSGSIPKSMGSCESLSDLNMAGNLFSGKIPTSLGSLPTLNSLNLSGNQLSGKIPETISSLRLSLLDLSNNRLSGPIPESLSIAAYNGSFSGNPDLCSLRISPFPRCLRGSGVSKHVRNLILCFAIGSLIMLISLGCYLVMKKKENGGKRSLREEIWDVKSFHLLSFSENEILDSIKQENLIGKGGSGNVYKAVLSNGKQLAVKHIWNTYSTGQNQAKGSSPMLKRPGKSRQFDSEVQTLSSIRHVNVVKLYCSITSEDSSLLVYEYLSNGSLWDMLHRSDKTVLDWEKRYEIALGAAKGLEYLHHGCDRPVIHRDVKSSNILLDEFLKPRIADFGLAKIVQANLGKDSTHVIAGTHGYIAPEYGYTYKVNEKSDVYSFGVVLMELVTGKRPIEPEYGDNRDIVKWVCSKRKKSKEKIKGVIDSRIEDRFEDDAMKVLRIAILCTTSFPRLRPTMRSVVQMLEDVEPSKLVGIVVSDDGKSSKTAVPNKENQNLES